MDHRHRPNSETEVAVRAARDIDEDVLRQSTGGDAALARAALALFETQAARWRPALRPGSPASVWMDACHTIRGTAGSIGATRLAAACAAAELAEKQDDDVGAALALVERRLDAALRAGARLREPGTGE